MADLKKLIGFHSYSGQERPLLDYLKTQLEGQLMQPFFQKDNLVVKLTGQDQRRALIFNGHVDVVDIGDPANWKHDPWDAAVVQGRIYGRGTSDMKGGVWALAETAISLSHKVVPTDVWFTFVVREETNGEGTAQFAKWFQSTTINQYHELAAIFAEPTGLDNVKYGHRGQYFFKAESKGVAGHSSRPHLIRPHAVLGMVQFINDLETENKEWLKNFQNSEFGAPTVTLTSIEGISDSPNKTADYCQANFDLRTIPNCHEKAFERLQQLANKRGIKLSLLHPPGPIGYTKPDAKIIKACRETLPGLALALNDASNDLGFFTNIGIEGIIFGPGDESQAHSTNESADMAKIMAAPELFEKIYFAWTKK